MARRLILSLLLGFCSLCAAAYAETVFVKYRGPVNLDEFSCKYTVSSFVHRICYRANERYLIVLLDQTYYHYCKVPASFLEQWMSAPSLGRFYGSYVRGNYDCRAGGVPLD